MWSYVVNISLSLVGFYLFCISIAHLFMYKPSKDLFNQLKATKSTYVFTLLGICIWFGIEKVKVREKWFYLVYRGCFLSVSVASFVLMITNL